MATEVSRHAGDGRNFNSFSTLAVQDHLLKSSETLMSRSNDLQDTLIKLLDYEAKTEKAIRQVLGRSFRVYDLAVYIIGMVVGLALGNVRKTHSAGGPVFAVFCVGLLIHRFLSDTWNTFGLLDSDVQMFSVRCFDSCLV